MAYPEVLRTRCAQGDMPLSVRACAFTAARGRCLKVCVGPNQALRACAYAVRILELSVIEWRRPPTDRCCSTRASALVFSARRRLVFFSYFRRFFVRRPLKQLFFRSVYRQVADCQAPPFSRVSKRLRLSVQEGLAVSRLIPRRPNPTPLSSSGALENGPWRVVVLGS
jgi:hypothetical protein